MDGAQAQMAFVDCPYNVPIPGHVSGQGRARHKNFIMGSGEMTHGQYTTFLSRGFEAIARHVAPGAIAYSAIDWRHLPEMLTAGTAAFRELRNICVWAKDNAGMGSFYRSAYELILVYRCRPGRPINNVSLGASGRYRTNIWSYAGVNTFKRGRQEELAMHPTVKPWRLVADAIRDVSHRGGIVLDTFVGSGTTIVAAERTGRVCYAMDLDPHYCDVAIERWQKFTGLAARHAETGRAFSGTTVERPSSPARRPAKTRA